MPAPSPDWSDSLLDDGALLGARGAVGADLARVVSAHAAARDTAYGTRIGTLVVTERELTHLGTGDLPVHLAVTGGAGALEAALRWATGPAGSRVSLRRASVRLRGESELAHNARRVVTVLDSVDLPDDVALHAAPPAPAGPPGHLSPAWLTALDELAAREVGLLLPAAAPWTAAAVDAALDRELSMVFTGEAVADVRAAMSAVRVALDGEVPPDDWLEQDLELALRTRRWCTAVVLPDLGAVADL